MAENAYQRYPKTQQSQPRHQAAHRTVRRIVRDQRKVEDQRIIVPQKARPGKKPQQFSRPRRNPDYKANEHQQHGTHKQLGALQPARNPLRRVLAQQILSVGRGHGIGDRLGSRVHGTLRRGRLRLLGHFYSSHTAPNSSPVAGTRNRPIHRPVAGTPYCNGNTAAAVKVMVVADMSCFFFSVF